jgi:hypothetical protein
MKETLLHFLAHKEAIYFPSKKQNKMPRHHYSTGRKKEKKKKKAKTPPLIPKGRSLVFGPFFKFGQAIVDAIFVQKISNFR